jgi:mannitol-1-phosphate 5-dehydrogenase
MEESACALSGKYGVALEEILQHITDLLHRFTNAALLDTCARVGGDPARKLSPDDRLIGSLRLALEQGVTPAYIAVGAAAGVYRYIRESENMEQGMAQAQLVLSTVSGLKQDSEPMRLILDMYRMILQGADIAQLRRGADIVKAAAMKPIV